MNTTRHWVEPNDIASVYDGIPYWWAPVDNRITPIGALWNLLSGKPYHLSRFWSDEFAQTLKRVLTDYRPNLIFIEGLPPTQYLGLIANHSLAATVYRAHNIEYYLWERVADAEQNFIKQRYLREQVRRLQAWERKLFVDENLDGIVAISSNDAAMCRSLGFAGHVCVVPFSVDLRDYSPVLDPTDPPTVFHIGSLYWEPNRQGVEWFLREIFPLVRKRFPGATFHLAGAIPEHLSLPFKDGVIVHGIVRDAKEFMRMHSVLIVPLLSGSGIRSKIIEAMALGKAVVSTSIGAEGLDCTNGEHLLLADEPESFADAVVALLTNRELVRQLGMSARRLVEERYNLDRAREALARFLIHVATSA